MNNTPNDYVFVFTEPIDNTDVQFKELESLLILSSFQLMDVYDISLNRFISNPPDVSPNNNIVYRVKFKQSCILRTLAPIDLLHEIIKRSAYVDSCGPYVYSSKMDKSSITSIRSAMTKFITSNEISSFELSFFTHEKFSDKAGKKSRLLIDEKRFFLGDLPFDQVQKHFEDWTGPGTITFEETRDVDARIWGYSDIIESVDSTSNWVYPEKNDEIYLIVYRPKFRLRNPLYSLDAAREAKPYWKGIDTTPQQLMGAMLNLAQVQPGQVILEPFTHTGTLLHEAVKLDLLEIIYNDKFETLGAKDNLDILTAPPDNILTTVSEIERLIQLKHKDRQIPTCSEIQDVVGKSIKWLPDKPYPVITSVEDLMIKHDWMKKNHVRLFFYIIRRFFIEQRIGYIESAPTQIYQIFGGFKTQGDLLQALESFISNKLKLLNEYAEKRKFIGNERSYRGIIDIGYEPLSQSRCRFLENGKNVDITNGIPLDDNTVDAVVTDPPYGYGSSQEQDEIYQLYQCFFKEVFRVLKPGGHLTMCVLDKVRTGKDINDAVMTEGVVSLANDIAKKNKISFIVDRMRPFNRDIQFLSYWKAQYKLNRGILSFQVNK